MKITMPLITLLSGAAVGVAVLIASTLSTPAAPSVRNQAATAPVPTPATAPAATPTVIVTLPPPASSATVVTLPPPASSAPAAASTTTPAAAPTTGPATAPAVTPTAPASSPYAVWSANADYAGEADNGGAWVTISVRGRRATAYVRTGYGQARLNGTAAAGVLYLTGQNDARLAADYNAARAVGYVIADGIRYPFSAPAVHGTAASSQSAA
jgi:hypothetical protein